MASKSLLFNPFLSSRSKICHQNSYHQYYPRKAILSTKILASRRSEAHDHYQNCSGGRLVDENMIVLRKRMHEMKMIERNYEPPADWMEWEKRYYTSYDSIICDFVGVLQSQLMNTRPSLALGMLALITLSVPTSAAVMFYQLMELTKGVLVALQGSI